MNNILVHYHEIALKGKNRINFENALVKNIKGSLKDERGFKGVKRLFGRILIELDKDTSKADLDRILGITGDVFGISSYSPVLIVDTDLKKIEKGAVEVISDIKSGSFKVESKRAYKQFPLNSLELSSKVGSTIVSAHRLKVDVKKPKTTVRLEVLKDKTFIYHKKIKGRGGLPVSTAGKVISLISGGIDSPIASYLTMKRGALLEMVHFHSYPYTDKASIEKVEELLRVLKKFQMRFKLHLVPIIEFQKAVVRDTDPRYRIILYRRLMYKVAQALASKSGALAIVSGDSLGQVASQTLENMATIGHGIDLPILRPLVGFDKEEIIEMAKDIGTFDLSIEPHGDCCSIFLPKNPATRSRLEPILEQEKALGMQKWIQSSLKNTKTTII